MTYIEIQNRLIEETSKLFDEKDRVDAVTFNGKEFVIFVNTHASSRPQITHYLGRGDKCYVELLNIIGNQ